MNISLGYVGNVTVCKKIRKEKIYFVMLAPLEVMTHNTTLTLLNVSCLNARKKAVFEGAGSLVYCLGNIFTRKQTTIYHSNSKYIFLCINPSRKHIVLENVNVLCRILRLRAVQRVQEPHQSHPTHKLGRGEGSNLLPY
jgi:hypothetical protein